MNDESTGPRFATTPYGTYSVREGWLDRRMPTLAALADFLVGHTESWGMTLNVLRQMIEAADDDQRELLRIAHPREDAALHHWQNLSPLYPITDAHGPTMRQLVDQLADYGHVGEDQADNPGGEQ